MILLISILHMQACDRANKFSGREPSFKERRAMLDKKNDELKLKYGAKNVIVRPYIDYTFEYDKLLKGKYLLSNHFEIHDIINDAGNYLVKIRILDFYLNFKTNKNSIEKLTKSKARTSTIIVFQIDDLKKMDFAQRIYAEHLDDVYVVFEDEKLFIGSGRIIEIIRYK